LVPFARSATAGSNSLAASKTSFGHELPIRNDGFRRGCRHRRTRHRIHRLVRGGSQLGSTSDAGTSV
jgi:hypothetical protein